MELPQGKGEVSAHHLPTLPREGREVSAQHLLTIPGRAREVSAQHFPSLPKSTDCQTKKNKIYIGIKNNKSNKKR